MGLRLIFSHPYPMIFNLGGGYHARPLFYASDINEMFGYMKNCFPLKICSAEYIMRQNEWRSLG